MPEIRFPGAKTYIGMPEGRKEVPLEAECYHIRKRLAKVLSMMDNEEDSYLSGEFEIEVEDRYEDYLLGDRVSFQGRRLVVTRKTSRLKNSEWVHSYILTPESGCHVERIYNPKLAGAAIRGTVTETSLCANRLALVTDVEAVLAEYEKRKKFYSPLIAPDGSVIRREGYEEILGTEELWNYFIENVAGKDDRYPLKEDTPIPTLYEQWLDDTYGKTQMGQFWEYMCTVDGLQSALDVIGLVWPPADIANAVIYLCRGQYDKALWSAAFSIPALGDLLGIGKLGKLGKGLSFADLGKSLDNMDEMLTLNKVDYQDVLDVRRADNVFKGGSTTLQTGGRQIDYNAYIKRLETIDMEYENIRINTTDISKISQNTGMPEWKISRIKEHVFSNEHILDSGIKRFDADSEIADAWYRLTNGTFNQNDIDLLNHEYFESKFESFYKTDYRTAT